MPLPLPHPNRKRLHQRKVVFEGWERDERMLDIEAQMTDIKDHDVMLGSGPRAMGQPIHDMRIRVTVDRKFNVVDVAASSDAVPYPGGCETINPAYRQFGQMRTTMYGTEPRRHFMTETLDQIKSKQLLVGRINGLATTWIRHRI